MVKHIVMWRLPDSGSKAADAARIKVFYLKALPDVFRGSSK